MPDRVYSNKSRGRMLRRILWTYLRDGDVRLNLETDKGIEVIHTTEREAEKIWIGFLAKHPVCKRGNAGKPIKPGS